MHKTHCLCPMHDILNDSMSEQTDRDIDRKSPELELAEWKGIVWQLREELKQEAEYSTDGQWDKNSAGWLARLNEMLEECGLEL